MSLCPPERKEPRGDVKTRPPPQWEAGRFGWSVTCPCSLSLGHCESESASECSLSLGSLWGPLWGSMWRKKLGYGGHFIELRASLWKRGCILIGSWAERKPPSGRREQRKGAWGAVLSLQGPLSVRASGPQEAGGAPSWGTASTGSRPPTPTHLGAQVQDKRDVLTPPLSH